MDKPYSAFEGGRDDAGGGAGSSPLQAEVDAGAAAGVRGRRGAEQKHPANTEDHDLLIIPKLGQLQQVLVDKRTWKNGVPDPSTGTGIYETVKPPSPPEDPGRRKAMSVAEPADDRSRGPAFACLPIKPEPASSFYTCYLVNGNNVRFNNDWTAAEWNDVPELAAPQPPAAQPGPVSFEILLAGPQGTLFHVRVDDGKGVCEPVASLSEEAEIWTQLRSGVVAGQVRYEHHPTEAGRIVPIVNVTALQP